ncbi:MAG: ABC transporter ATP-binding protein [bacterium]
MGALLSVRSLHRHYVRGEHTVRALDGVDLDVAPGSFVALVGASGSGKSTLLNLLGGLDRPTAGDVLLEGRSLASYSRRELATYRATRVGMIFQSFHLIPHYTAIENVELGLYFGPVREPGERRSRSTELLERLGLGERLHHRPADLSGGEQQRVAIARALAGNPDVLLADEPTGNLDAENAALIAGLLREQREEGRAVVMTTHNLDLAHDAAERVVRLAYGKIAGEST